MEYQPVIDDKPEKHWVQLCAWCDKDGKRTEAYEAKKYRVSHGMCKKHGKEAQAQLAKMPAESLQYRNLKLMMEALGRIVIDESTQWDAFSLQDFIKAVEQDSDTRVYYLVEPKYNPRIKRAEQLWVDFNDLGLGKTEGMEAGSLTINVPPGEPIEVYNAKYPVAQHSLDRLNAAGLAWLSDFLTHSWNNKDYPTWEAEIYQLLKDKGFQLASAAIQDDYGNFLFPMQQTTHFVMDESASLTFSEVAHLAPKCFWVEKDLIGRRVFGAPRYALSVSQSEQCAYCAFLTGIPMQDDYIYISNEPFRNEKDPVLLKEMSKRPEGREILTLSQAALEPTRFLDACLNILTDAGFVMVTVEGGEFRALAQPRSAVHQVTDEAVLAVEAKNVGAGMDVETLNFGEGPRWVPAMVLKETTWMGRKAWHLLLENGEDVIRDNFESEVRMRRPSSLFEVPEEPEHFEPGQPCLLKYGERAVPVEFVKDLGERADHHFMRTYRVRFADGSTIYKPGSEMDTYAFNVMSMSRHNNHNVVDEAHVEVPETGTHYIYTIQRPLEHDGRIIPGYIQIDQVVDGRNTFSSNLKDMAKRGIDLPVPPDNLPTGQYTLEQVEKALHQTTAA
jgi:hypothetical protein